MIILYVLDIETTFLGEVVEVYIKNLLSNNELHIFIECEDKPYYYDRNKEYYDSATYIPKKNAILEIEKFFNCDSGKKVILGYNSNSFDRPHIKRMIDLSEFHFLDAYHYLTKKIDLPLYSRSLETICKHYRIINYTHTAKEDCENLLKVIKHISNSYPSEVSLFEKSCAPDHRIGKGNIYGRFDIGLEITKYLVRM